jgi:hypothetical protein
MGPAPVHLVATRDRGADIDAFAAQHGGRAGLEPVLADLNRSALPAFDTGSAATWGFRWDREDDDSSRWWPQGITSSADAVAVSGPRTGAGAAPVTDEYAGRRLLVTTSYSKTVDGVDKGCRISVVDITDEGAIRYRHVLLAVVGLDDAGGPELRPVHAHAGGIVWRGRHLHVAATARGIHTFCIDDVVRVPTDVGLGHRYVLPLRTSWSARTAEGERPMAHSFLSLAEHGSRLLVGEYGRGRMTRRLLTYDLDASGLPVTGDDGVAVPTMLPDGPARMQGAALVDGRLHVVTSNGKRGRGSLWVGPPGDLREVSKVLPPGPEDITYWPSREELWVPTEYPGRRFVLAYDRKRLG